MEIGHNLKVNVRHDDYMKIAEMYNLLLVRVVVLSTWGTSAKRCVT